MGYKKIIIFSTFLLASLAFPVPVNEANRIIDIQQRQLEQERIRQQQEKMQKEFENTKFDSPKPQIDKDIESSNFNSINANNMTMEVLPGRKENYSRIEVKNTLKNKYTVGILTNNYGDSKQNGIWRRGINLNIDSPLGIGDNFYFTYMTVPKKDPNRSWKKTVEQLQPGEILPIGPTGYDPLKGDILPYKRRLDMFNFGYTIKFRTYTLKLNSSKSIQESSFYSANTVYDMYSGSHTLSANLEKIP